MSLSIKVSIILLFIATISLQETPKIQKLLLSTNRVDEALENDLRKIRSLNNVQDIISHASNIQNSNQLTCQSKNRQIQEIVKILQEKVSINEQQIQTLRVSKDNTRSNNDKIKIKDMLMKMKKQIQSSSVLNQIKIEEIEKQTAVTNAKEQARLLNQYLNDLQQMKKGNSAKDESKNQAVQRLQEEMRKLDLLIESVQSKRKSVNKNITILKIKQLEQNQISFVDPDQIQQKYKEYSELAIQSSRKSKDKEEEINKLNAKLKSISGNPTAVDKQIQKTKQQLDQLKHENNSKIFSDSSDISEVLLIHSDNLQGKIQALLKQCSS